ncbi:MAG: cobyric acid synthase, partial [Alphaproteobacteria bacterium]|nr:cobyric acid synthase [Alphaproteobacteria bacterium]
DYYALKPSLLPRVLESFERLAAEADIVIVEGAGSAAEVNLRAADIANMGFAEAAGVPVVLVGDIDRGGVIAALVGTHALLAPSERARLKGYIINKFRGDPRLFDGAVATLREHTGLKSLGIVPFFPAARDLPAEDGVALDSYPAKRNISGLVRIAVPRLPRMANFDDLDPLAAEPEVRLDLVEPGRPLPGDADLVLLPGSKATLADLAALRSEGWDIDLLAHVRRGGRVLGLCGGYQMMGHRIADPQGIEGPAGEARGLGLLDIDTVLSDSKTLREASGVELSTGERVRGYEMHVGATTGAATAQPMLRVDDASGPRPEGARDRSGLVAGCYLHGLFASDGFRRAFVNALGGMAASDFAYEAHVEATLDALAAHLERHLDVAALLDIAHAR